MTRGLRWAGLGALSLFIALCVALFVLDRLLPPDLGRWQERSSEVVAADGRLLRAFLSRDDAWRYATTPEQVSPLYLELLLAFEDKRFHRHPGVDPLAMSRAVWQALRHRRIVSGASTLTMQSARLLEPRPRRTLSAKLAESWRALQLESRLSKSEILGIYLTLAPFGGNLEGVRAASLAYFGKEPDRLTPAEAALLVALPQAPNRLRPDRHPERARAARDKVLARGLESGVLSAAQVAEAQQARVPSRRRPQPFLAPHLAERLRAESPRTERIVTTLDADLQAQAEHLARLTATTLGPRLSAAAIVAELPGGDIRARVGSADYFAAGRDGMVDMSGAPRSPGSALKPFIYGLAFERLIAHPDTLVRDRPYRFGAYAPRNFDHGFHGEVSLRDALRASLNLPAVMLLERLGPAAFLHWLEEAGASPVLDDAADPGLALALGGVGISLEEMAMLYAGLGRDGHFAPLSERPDASSTPTRHLGTPAAWYLQEILLGAPRPLAHDRGAVGADTRRIAFKTGTSAGYRDAWAIGWSGRWLVAVWVGRPDSAPCQGCVGALAAAPLMFRLFDLLPPEPPRLAARAPSGALPGPTAALPRRLQRLDAPSYRQATGTPPPSITFPLDGSTLPLAAGAATGVPLKASGGVPPLRWLIDGRPLGEPMRRGDPLWLPEGPGFSELSVIDAAGRSARVRIRVEE